MSPEIIELQDAQAGSRAKILAGFGFNCYEFVTRVAGREVSALWSAKDFASGRERASGSGIPLLFPFPGRLRGSTLRWGGREFHLQAGDGRGNAIHGFVLNRPWRVLQRDGNQAVGQFQARVDAPELLNHWPADFRITATYELKGNRLVSHFEVENPDQQPLPCGLGTHPYFRLPLGGDSAAACTVSLPVTKRWELVNMLPTGVCEPLADATPFQRGLRFGDMQFDDVFGGLLSDHGFRRSTIHDPGSGRTLMLEFSETFRECVVYTPPHREAICIEPYTCVPGAWDLALAGADVGLRTLQPGETFAAQVAIEVR